MRLRVRVLAYRGDDVLYYQIDGRLLPAASDVPASDRAFHLVDGLECARGFSFHYESYAATHAIDACVFHYEYPALAAD